MKQIFVSAAFAMAFAVMAVGCASETTEGSGEFGSVGVNLLVGDTDVKAVSFELVCDSGFALNGQFNVNDEQDPPIWAAIMDVPVPNPETGEPCSIVLIASDDAGNVLCTGEESFVVEVNVEPVKVDVVLLCGDEGDDPLGNIDIDATFEIIEGNNCPRLHFLNAVPDEVPAEGSDVTVWVSDKDGDTLTTELAATSGSFEDESAQLTNTADPVSVLTTYSCENGGEQTISVTVSDGDAACDKVKSFDVVCPGVDPCEGVTCDDTGNECTVAECVDGVCVTSDVDNDTPCGGNVDVAMNGGLEEGSLNGWTTEFCDGTSVDSRGLCELSDMANTGSFAVRLFNDQPASASVLKQANKFPVSPGDQVAISFAAKGATAAGGVVFAEFFSEIAGGGTSASEILGSLALTNEYQFFSFNAVAGADVSGGITLQFAAVTGGDAGSTSEVIVDDVSITVDRGEAGTCQEGVCEPIVVDLCEGNTCDSEDTECSDSSCDAGTGQCVATPINQGGDCDGGNGTCNAGVCEPNVIDLCEGNTCDSEDTECSDSSCDVGTGQCVSTPINEGNDCDGGAGTCSAGDCVPNATANAFIKTLDPNNGFQTSLIDTVDTTNLPDTWGGYTASITIPDDDAFINQVLQFGFQNNASNFQSSGVFYDNVVLNPGPEYTQDFDSFDITVTPIGDGWLFFNNVFDSAGNRKFGYNGLAPNATADTDPSDGETFISAIVDDQGGAGQGTQQLSVFSDYNCCGAGTTNEGHFGTDLVEVNVFQERRLTADDLGVTLEFIFEAKAGNIGQ